MSRSARAASSVVSGLALAAAFPKVDLNLLGKAAASASPLTTDDAARALLLIVARSQTAYRAA